MLCSINIFSKYAWVVSLKDKIGVTILNVFQKVLNDSMKSHLKKKKENIG